MKRLLCSLILPGVLACVCHAEFLFTPDDPSPNGFFTPTITFIDGEYEYSAWDVFYAPHGAGNYPDIFAPAGGVWDAESGTWKPELRTSAGFPSNPAYNPSNPYAFWDAYNPTITQIKSTTAFIIGPDASGNIYTFQDKTGYQLHNHPDYADQGGQLGTVVFQFQTDGTNVDFSNIRLGYKASDGNTYYLGVNDPQTEYLREYSTTGSDHWSATAGYRNRVLLQWDLSGVDGTGEFWIEWESLSSSMSFQKVDLLTASYYEVGMPVSSTWVGTSGEWSDSANWQGQAGGTPMENGNLKFKNAAAASVDIDDGSHMAGEIIFDNAADVTLSGHKLTANTGITTRNGGADAVYTFDADYELGALNFFEVNTGSVVMNGGISGDYGLVKLGAGTLEFNGDNTFTGFLAVQDGTLRLNGANAYTGSTTVVNGRVIVANEAVFGHGTSALAIGGDADLYAFTTGAQDWLAELLIDGDIRISRNITLGAGELGKHLGAFNTVNGAEFSGNISFSGLLANPDAPGGASAVGNTHLTAEAATDRLIFSGQMTGGSSAKTVTVDGLGTVVYSGVDKTYNTSTHVASGTLLIESGLTGAGNVVVNPQGVLHVNGVLAGSGSLVLNAATLTGSGTVSRAILADAGDVLSPGNGVGVMSTAGQTWGGGGIYLWEIGALSGGAGAGWDLFDITGALNITATESDRFILRITSLDALDGFDPAANYSWKIAAASEGIAGFSGDAFLLDTDFFQNAFDGFFSLGLDGGDLFLNYTAAEKESQFAVWLDGAEPTPELLRAYALGGTVEAGAPASDLIRDDNDLVLVAVVRTDDPDLSVYGEFVASVLDFGDAEKTAEVEAIMSPDQTGVPAGCQRWQFRISMSGRSQGFLRLRIWLDEGVWVVERKRLKEESGKAEISPIFSVPARDTGRGASRSARRMPC